MEKAELAEKFGLPHEGRIVNGKDYTKTRCVLVTVNLILLSLFLFAVIFGLFPFRNQDYAVSRFYHSHHDYRIHIDTLKKFKIQNRPPFAEKAKMARYVVHNSNWGVMTTFCTHNKGYPWGEVVSITDGLENNSTGIPLVYISVLDVAAQDLEINNLASFTFSEAEGDWCRQHSLDPEDPRCSRIHLFGKIVKLKPEEIPKAKEAMFKKHPVMATWPPSHHFFFAKMELQKVEVLDFFGPLSEVSVEDYLKVKL